MIDISLAAAVWCILNLNIIDKNGMIISLLLIFRREFINFVIIDIKNIFVIIVYIFFVSW